MNLDTFGTDLRHEIPLGFELATSFDAIGYRLSTKSLFATRVISAWFAKDLTDPFRFVIAASRSGDWLEIRLEDIQPELSTTLKLRSGQWVQRRLAEMLSELERQVGP